MRPTSLKSSQGAGRKRWLCGVVTSRVAIRTLEEGPTPSRVLQAYCGLLGSKVRAPPPRCRPPLRPPFPSKPPGASPPWPSCLQLRGPGAAAQPRTRPGARASARTMTPFSPRRLLLPTPPPRSPQTNLLAIQADKTPRPRALSRGAHPATVISPDYAEPPDSPAGTGSAEPHSPPAPGPASQ